MFKGELIKGYRILQDFTTAGGGLSKWTFARKNGEDYFLKEFLYPKYPTKNAPGSAKTKARKKKACEQFERHHQAIIREINDKCGPGGNLVYTVDFFRNETKYYKVTEKIDVASLSIGEIAALPLKSRVLILKTIAHSLNILHKADIVHGDLKPDNVLIKQTKTGNYTTKLIDFDNSYFSGHPPEMSEDLVGDMVFYSPELAEYIQNNEALDPKGLTVKSDIFALGLLFCMYLSGGLPHFDQEKYGYAGIAVREGEKLSLPPLDLPKALVQLLARMLHRDFRKRPLVGEIFEELKGLTIEDSPDPKARIVKTKFVAKKEKPASETTEAKPKNSAGGTKLRGKGLNIGKK